jgi:uncharacterized protein (DUF427 family)
MKIPGLDHPITIEPAKERVIVRAGGKIIADSTAALRLQEANYPAVLYVPLADVDASLIRPSDTTTYCPYKGEANYYHLTAGGTTVDDAIWTYEQPYAAVAQIAGHVAFYATKADVAVA